MNDKEAYMNSLNDVIEAVEKRGMGNTNFRYANSRVSTETLVTLLYGARNAHECAISDEEYKEIIDAIHEVEDEIGIAYNFDQYHFEE